MDGFLLIDKPSGWTSHDVVARARAITGIKKIGHAGTLDPLATGLLVLGIGRATRLLRYVQGAPKEYEATAQFGVATDTLDADGAVLSREPMVFEREDLEAVATRFCGEIMQVPPMVSARKVEGKRLYELARAGEEIEREPRPVTIYDLEVLDLAPSEYPIVTFRVTCGTGTYVRTLADDIARGLGGRAHLTALRRTRNGSLHVLDAASIERLASGGPAAWRDRVLSLRDGLVDLPERMVSADLVKGVSNGLALPSAAIGGSSPGRVSVRMVAPDGALLAVYGIEDTKARPEVVVA